MSSDTLVPLRRWIEGEVKEQLAAARQTTTISIAGCEKERRKEMILRKTTVAYGMAEVLRRARPNSRAPHTPLSLSQCYGQICSADNFVVRSTSNEAAPIAAGWRNIKGVDMLSPQLSVNISEPYFLRSIFASGDEQGFDQQGEVQTGRYLEVEFSSGLCPLSDLGEAAAVSQSEEDVRCHSLGFLLYELFSHNSSLPVTKRSKKARLSEPGATGEDDTSSARVGKILLEMGFPSSICLVVQNLLECVEGNRPDNAYDSLDTGCCNQGFTSTTS